MDENHIFEEKFGYLMKYGKIYGPHIERTNKSTLFIKHYLDTVNIPGCVFSWSEMLQNTIRPLISVIVENGSKECENLVGGALP